MTSAPGPGSGPTPVPLALLDGVPDAAAAWTAATTHPFLDAVRDGRLAPGAFATWLAQDALFVADLLAFQARLVARAPRPAQRVLAGGVVALVAELDWFDALAAHRGLDLDVEPLEATRDYADLLAALDAAPYPEAVTCLWALERVYLDAWTSALPATGDDAEVVEHWTGPAFEAYVTELERLAAAAAPELADRRLLLAVLHQEAAFWAMADRPADDRPADEQPADDRAGAAG